MCNRRIFLPHPSFPATAFSSSSPALQTSWGLLKMGYSSWAQRYQFLPVSLPVVLPSELPQRSEVSPGCQRPEGLPHWAQDLRQLRQPPQQLWGQQEKNEYTHQSMGKLHFRMCHSQQLLPAAISCCCCCCFSNSSFSFCSCNFFALSNLWKDILFQCILTPVE